MNKNLKIKTTPTQDRIGSKKNKYSLITKTNQYISRSIGSFDTPVSWDNIKENEAEEFDLLENQIIEDYNNQYNPDLWIQQDIEYFQHVLRKIPHNNDPFIDDYLMGAMFIHFEGEKEPRLKPQDVDKDDFINMVGKKWINRKTTRHIAHIKETYPDNRIANYAAEALLWLVDIKLSLAQNNAKEVFLKAHRVGELKKLILIKKHEVAILTQKEKIDSLSKTNPPSVSTNEMSNIKKLVIQFYEQDSKLTHEAIVHKAIDELYENGELPDTFVDNNGQMCVRKSPLSENNNRYQLVKNIAKHYLKKKAIKECLK